MKNLAFSLSIFFISATALAQTSGQVSSYSNTADGGFTDAAVKYVSGSITEADQKFNFEDNSVQGSPYTSNAFIPTTLSYDGKVIDNIFYRYNAYNEEIEMKSNNIDDAPVKALSKDKKIAVDVNGTPLTFRTFIDKNGNTLNGYLQILDKGDDYTLYKRTNVKFTEGQKAQNSFVKAVPAKFSHFTEYYIEVKGENRISEIKLRNKNLLKLLPKDDKADLAVYMKENNLNIKDEQDLKKVFDFLNMDS